MLKFFTVTLVALLVVGCANGQVNTAPQDAPSVTGIVLDTAELAQGGPMALAPFKAGPQAEANEELDRLSMMILKGIKDSLDNQRTSLRVSEEDKQPRMVLEGYVQEFSRTTRLSRVLWRPDRDSIVLVGEIWLSSSGKRLLNFVARKKFNPKKERLMEVVYHMGRDIGDFIAAKA